MPLVWAHAEFLKLAASRKLGRPFDRPASVWTRYHGQRPLLTRVLWCEQAPASELPETCALTIALREVGSVRYGFNGWQDIREESTRPSSLGVHVLEIDTQRLRAGQHVDFTYRAGATWVGRDFRILIVPRGRPPA